MNVTIAIFLGLSVAIMFIFFYMFARDKIVDKKFALISAALENINQEIYKLHKSQKDDSLKDIESMITNQLDVVLDSLLKNIQDVQYTNKREIELLYDKIVKIENGVKNMRLPNLENVNKKENKEKIKELYEIGYSIEEIAKQEGIPAGEVQFILKL